MAKIVFRQEAIDDLNAIWEYSVEEWSESQADKYYLALKSACVQVGKNPKKGKSYDGIRKGLLGFKSGKHIIFYQQIAGNEIEIIRILHERMDIKDRMSQ